jgi:hypothetical protein
LHEVVRCQSSQASQSVHYPRNPELVEGTAVAVSRGDMDELIYDSIWCDI